MVASRGRMTTVTSNRRSSDGQEEPDSGAYPGNGRSSGDALEDDGSDT